MKNVTNDGRDRPDVRPLVLFLELVFGGVVVFAVAGCHWCGEAGS